MKKLTSALLSLSLLVLPVVASAQPIVTPHNHEVLVAAAKKTVKKMKKAKSSKTTMSAASSASSIEPAIDASCTIKGNISKTKEKIFHVLGCPNYGQTVIDTTKGERMFCSEKEAKDAGWRKALNCP